MTYRTVHTLVALAGLALAGGGPRAVAGTEKLLYEPLSAEAGKLGRLQKYRGIDQREVTINLGSLNLKAHVPARCDAYDAVPIQYTLDGDCDVDDRLAIEAVAFEDESRRKGRHLYDLALPGNMKLRIEYLGSQTGIFEPRRVSRLTATSRHETFPPYRLEPMVRSGTVKRGNYLFFKFRITNAGDTILDAEGFGGWMAIPHAYLIGKNGKRQLRASTINRYERHLEYLYPGESFEQWISFWTTGQKPAHVRTLPVGKYVIRYEAAYRWNKQYDWIINMWGGKSWFGLEVPVEIAETARPTPVEPKEVVLDGGEADRMTRYVGSLEEFMTSFKVFERDELQAAKAGTIHLQVAPWTQHVVLKLIGNKPGRIMTAAVPIQVSTGNLAIRYNPDNPFTVVKDGRRIPAFCTQNMAAMRSTTQLGPQPEKHMRDRLREALDCGVNVICTTAGDWHISEIYNKDAFVGDIHAETFKHYYDVIASESGVPVFGWGLFPCRTHHMLEIGSHYWGRTFKVPSTGDHYAYAGKGDLDVGHRDYPRLMAGAILFNYKRWGDLWYRTADGDVIIDVEDTWGWLRDDINVRYWLGRHALRKFQRWARAKYGTIEKANEAWGTTYGKFSDIDPQADQFNEGKAYGIDLTRIAPVYTNKDNPFHDWSPAMEDWDHFRTELRCDVYESVLRHVRRVIPQAQINIRTEGGFIPVAVPPDSDVSHLRHCYYAQRRQALISEVLQKRRVFKYHSDYTTIPYTESEWRFLLRRLHEEGIRGNYLPQFCTARDMVLNDHWGRDSQVNYNLAKPRRAIMMHVLQAAYPVWRIMYEEGHCPGVLWEDYGCDGFVTETQKRELRLFRAQLDEMEPPADK